MVVTLYITNNNPITPWTKNPINLYLKSTSGHVGSSFFNDATSPASFNDFPRSVDFFFFFYFF